MTPSPNSRVASGDEVLSFEALARHGVVPPEDLRLFRMVDDPEMAFELLRDHLGVHCLPEPGAGTPSIARSASPRTPVYPCTSGRPIGDECGIIP